MTFCECIQSATRSVVTNGNRGHSICLLIVADGVSCRAWAIKCPRRRKAPFAPKPRDKFFTRGGGWVPRCSGHRAGAL